MERLTEKRDGKNVIPLRNAICGLNLPYWKISGGDIEKFLEGDATDRLAAYEDAEQDGRLVVLPCKVGDTVWFNTYKNNATECVGIQPHEVKRVDVCFLTDGAEIPEWDIGKTAFLTRADAEAAMKGVSEDG